MYISKETLQKEYDNPKQKLKQILSEFITNADNAYVNNKEDTSKMLESLGCLNAFCKNQGFKKLNIDHKASDKNGYGRTLIKNYQSEFLIENSDLYNEYFPSFKYEFKPEKLEEIKKLVHLVKEEVINDKTLNEENKDAIIEIVEDLDKELKPQTNDVDTLIGKVFRLHMKMDSIKFNSQSIKQKLNDIFQKIVTTESYINKVESLINTGTRLLSYFS